MVLLKHKNFEFGNILRSGFKLNEDEPDVISEVKMGDGSIKRNYGDMPKTQIKVKFDDLDKEMYCEYISHFLLPEDEYTYFSFRQQKYITKRFFIKLPDISLMYANDDEQLYEEFEITLTQCGEVYTE